MNQIPRATEAPPGQLGRPGWAGAADFPAAPFIGAGVTLHVVRAGAVAPVAIVAVPVAAGQLPQLRSLLLSLARSRAAGGLPAAQGALAILVLAAEPAAALDALRTLASDYPFHLRVEGEAGDMVQLVRRAASWAAALDVAGAPVLLADPRRAASPRWAYGALAALRDGADVVSRHTRAWERLLFGPSPPIALSGQAQRAIEHWTHARRGVSWAERDSPWRRPAVAGLQAVTA